MSAGPVLTLPVVLLILSCAPSRPFPVPAVDICRTHGDSAIGRQDTVTVALAGPFRLDSIAQPRSQSEQFVSRQVYRSLVTLDCLGNIAPGLAGTWHAEDAGRSWVFGLSGESAVTAEVVRAIWDARRNGGLWPWPEILDVEVMDSLRLRVRLDRPHDSLPAAFADARLAITGVRGTFRVMYSASPPAGPVTATLFLVPAAPVASPVTLKVQVLRGGVDPRDALDFPRAGLLGRADVVITTDPRALAYADSRAEFQTLPLAWNVSYVLVTPAPSSEAKRVSLPAAVRDSMARDLAPATLRPAAPGSWWESEPCTTPAPVATPAAAPRIVYANDDPIARSIAERLVALAAAEGSWVNLLVPGGSAAMRPRTLPMTPAAMDSAVASGRPFAFVLPLSRLRPVLCSGVPRWAEASMITSLVDSRPSAIIRRGVPPAMIDGDGLLRFFTETSAP